jgi:hypothetical protein
VAFTIHDCRNNGRVLVICFMYDRFSNWKWPFMISGIIVVAGA